MNRLLFASSSVSGMIWIGYIIAHFTGRKNLADTLARLLVLSALIILGMAYVAGNPP